MTQRRVRMNNQHGAHDWQTQNDFSHGERSTSAFNMDKDYVTDYRWEKSQESPKQNQWAGLPLEEIGYHGNKVQSQVQHVNGRAIH